MMSEDAQTIVINSRPCSQLFASRQTAGPFDQPHLEWYLPRLSPAWLHQGP
jgi:hypothetical protein